MPLTLQMYKLEKKMASDHRKCPIKHLIQWTQVKKLPIIHLFQHLNSYQEPNHTIWSCQTLRKASRQCMESHQQNSSRNISTPLVLVFPLLSSNLLSGRGLEIKAGMTERKQREWNRLGRFWRMVRWGANSHFISLEVFNRKKKSKETKPLI